MTRVLHLREYDNCLRFLNKLQYNAIETALFKFVPILLKDFTVHLFFLRTIL